VGRKIPSGLIWVGTIATWDMFRLSVLSQYSRSITLARRTHTRSAHQVTLPNALTHIGSDAFCNCTALTEVILPASLTNIGERAFYGCVRLADVSLPDAITHFGNKAFYGCHSNISMRMSLAVTKRRQVTVAS
jgi:hypothetical protein